MTLVDITGASGAAERKRGRLADWIEAQEDAINELYGGDEPFLVRGVVLAPFDTRYNAETATRGGVDVIFGADALALLGWGVATGGVPAHHQRRGLREHEPNRSRALVRCTARPAAAKAAHRLLIWDMCSLCY